MKENYIQLEKDNILKLEITTSDGKSTGEFLEFDLDDIELLLKYQELIERDKKNKENLRNQLLIIKRREDIKGKKLLSKNEEDSYKAMKNFFEKEVEIYNMFLGEGGVEKLLNGRKIGWTTLEQIDKIIDKQIMPQLDMNIDKITKIVKDKYNSSIIKNKNVLKADE